MLNGLGANIALPGQSQKPKIKESASHHLKTNVQIYLEHPAEVSARRGCEALSQNFVVVISVVFYEFYLSMNAHGDENNIY